MEDFVKKAQEFQRIRVEQGEEAFKAAVQQFVDSVLAGNDRSALAQMSSVFVEALKKEEAAYQETVAKRTEQNDGKAERLKEFKGSPLEGDQTFLRMIQQSIPAMQSKAQFTAFMAAFDAMRGTMNAIFSMDEAATAKFKAALEQSFEAAKKVTEVTHRLRDVPDAASSKLAEEFKMPPHQVAEYDLQRQLMTELTPLDSLHALTSWWTTNRQRIDEVRTPMLRNPLIDAVRAKKEALIG